jgi:hypothetical protein
MTVDDARVASPRMDDRVPSSLQPMLQDLLSRLQRELPGLLAGFYLYGSVAYGAFNETVSDVDCLAVTGRACTAQDLAALRRIHRDIATAWPRCNLEISYVEQAHCGPWHSTTPPHPVYQHGTFHDRSQVELNSPLWSSILWWQIKRRGIALLGPEAAALDFEVSTEELLGDNRRLVETYWIDWGRSPALILKLRYPRAVDWVVLGMLRTYYTLREADVITKPGAADYGLARLPRRWHGLIREALAIRHRAVDRGILHRWRRAAQAALFARFMVAECRRVIAADGIPGKAK